MSAGYVKLVLPPCIRGSNSDAGKLNFNLVIKTIITQHSALQDAPIGLRDAVIAGNAITADCVV